MRSRSSAGRAWRCCTLLSLLLLGSWPAPSAADVEGQPSAADAGSRVRPSDAGGARAVGSASASAGSGLPNGHPPTTSVEPSADEQLPPGHPPTTANEAPRRAGGTQEQQQLPEDSADVDDRLPAGTIVVEVRDRFDHPMPNADVTLGIMQQSVAKGESRRRTSHKTDEAGNVRVDGLEFGGGVAYRVTVPWSEGSASEPATYAAPPFQLDLQHGQRVRVHVYPVTGRIEDAMIGMQGIVYIELKDDVLQFDELFQIYNVGAVTWVPSDVSVNLPGGYRAFNAQKEMSDVGFDEVANRGVKLRGTIAPGQHETHFRYQLPYDGSDTFEVTLALPPHVARMRVIAEASKSMSLRVADFPAAIADRNQRGQRVLVTERNVRSGDAGVTRVRITLDNIPTEGAAKWLAVGIAAATAGLGIYLALHQEKSKTKDRALGGHDAERARARLVAEIAALDRARQAGEIGPKAHARIRDALIDSLARVMAFTGT